MITTNRILRRCFKVKARFSIIAVISMLTAGMSLYMVSGGEIHNAVESRDIVKVRQLLTVNPKLVNAVTMQGSTPLHFASALNDTKIMKLLLDKGADINAKTNKGYTPLHWAASMDAGDAISLLVSRGADTKIESKDGSTPLQRAIGKKSDTATKALLTETASSYTDPFFDSRFSEGKNAVKEGRLKHAYEIFTDLLRSQPGNESINFAYGMTCFSMKDFSRARMAFERVLDINKNNDRARLELARTYMAMNQLELARQEFKQVLDRDPPESVRKNIKIYLEQIKRGIKRWRVFVRADTGYLDDNNVNVGPDSDVIGVSYNSDLITITTLTLDKDSQPIASEGYFTSVMFSSMYDIGNQSKWLLMADGSFYQNWLSNIAVDYESIYWLMSAGLKRVGTRSLFQLPLTVSHITYGHESLVNMYGLVPSYLYVSGTAGEWRWQTSTTIEMRDWEELNDRDSVYFEASETMKHFFGRAGHNIAIGVSLYHDRTDSDVYRNIGRTWNMDFEFVLPWDSRFYVKLKHVKEGYAEKEALAPEKRVDTQRNITIGCSKEITTFWGLDINYQQTENNSTYGLYQYNRNVLTVSTFCSF